MDLIAFTILRSTDPDRPLVKGGPTVMSMLLKHCALSAEVMVKFFQTWNGKECTGMVIFGPLNAASTLIPLLHDNQSQVLFTTLCSLMRTIAGDMPLAEYVMQGWQALAWLMKKGIPASALPYLQNTGEERARLKDVAASLLLMQPYDMREFLEEVSEGADKVELELGLLLAKWSALSVT